MVPERSVLPMTIPRPICCCLAIGRFQLPASCPRRSLRSQCAPIQRQGIAVVGSPIGSSAFQRSFVESELESFLRYEDDLLLLQPQCASRLILQSLSAAPAYIAQVVHPSVSRDPLSLFDDRLWALFLR